MGDRVRNLPIGAGGVSGPPLYAHHSPPEGMEGGWTKASQQLPPCRDDQLYVGINTAGFAGVFNAVIDIAGNVHCTYATPMEVIDVMGSLDIWQPLTPPTASAGSGKADSQPAGADRHGLPPLPDPDLRDVGTTPRDIKEFLRGYATEYALTALAARAPADSVLEDAARLDWLLLHISGAEFRRIGVHYSGNASRADVDAARKQGANHE